MLPVGGKKFSPGRLQKNFHPFFHDDVGLFIIYFYSLTLKIQAMIR